MKDKHQPPQQKDTPPKALVPVEPDRPTMQIGEAVQILEQEATKAQAVLRTLEAAKVVHAGASGIGDLDRRKETLRRDIEGLEGRSAAAADKLASDQLSARANMEAIQASHAETVARLRSDAEAVRAKTSAEMAQARQELEAVQVECAARAKAALGDAEDAERQAAEARGTLALVRDQLRRQLG